MKRPLSAGLGDLESQLTDIKGGGGVGLISLEMFGWKGFELWSYET